MNKQRSSFILLNTVIMGSWQLSQLLEFSQLFAS